MILQCSYEVVPGNTELPVLSVSFLFLHSPWGKEKETRPIMSQVWRLRGLKGETVMCFEDEVQTDRDEPRSDCDGNDSVGILGFYS